MLKKERRLSRKEINVLKKSSPQNKIFQGRFFGLVYLKNDQPGKFGLIISNKIAPLAVRRNNVKRLVFDAVKDTLLEEKGLFLFLAKRNCVEIKISEMLQEMENFRKLLK